MRPYTYTTQAQLRKAFWADHKGIKGISREKITDYAGTGKMHNTDTRTAFVNWIDYLCRNQEISPELAARATL